MATNPNNELIEILSSPSGPQARVTPFDGPATETYNARFEQVGVFRDDSVGANQSAQASTLNATDANAPTAFVPGRAGIILGVVGKLVSTTTQGAIASGSATYSATVGGVAVGDACALAAATPQVIKLFATPVSFNAGDLLGITLATSSLSPTNSLGNAWLLIKWAPIN